MTNDDTTTSATDIDRADHHKHMDYVQAIITRLGNNSFLLKGWALTLSSALVGFAITQKNAGLAVVAIAPVTAFWVLDTYYLHQERAFRAMYADIAAKKIRDFKIEPRGYAKSQSWRQTALSVSLSVFYVAIIGLALTIALILGLAKIHQSHKHDQPGTGRAVSPSNLPPASSSTIRTSQSSSTMSSPSSEVPAPTEPPQRAAESTTGTRPQKH